MAGQNPINDAILSLYEADADLQTARIAYERAQAKKTSLGRTAVPTVAAHLQEMELKRQKQQQAIAKAGQAGQAPARAMIPQTIDVSGQTGGRDMAGALKSASEIAQKVIGGPQPAAIQQGGIQGGFGQAAPGVGQGIAPPQGPPGSIQPQQVDLTGPERALSALGGALGIAGRSPQAAMQGFGELISGKRTVGYTQIPTADQQAEKLAPGLSVLVARSNSTHPGLSSAAEQELQAREQQIANELGPEVAASAMRQAKDLWLVADEERRIKYEDPIERTRRDKAMLEFAIEQKVAQGGVESLTHGERDVWEGRQRKTTNVINMPGELDKAGQRQISMQLDKQQTVMQYIRGFKAAFFEPGYELMSPADEWQLTLKDRAGTISAKERMRLRKYTEQKTAMSNMNVNVLHPLLGATMATGELEMADGLIVKIQKGGTAAKAAADELQEQTGLAMFRYEMILETNSLADPRYAKKLGDVRQAAKDAWLDRVEDLQAQGLDEATAVQQAREDFNNRYGLDMDRLQGTQP